jgi:hypothetical protein
MTRLKTVMLSCAMAGILGFAFSGASQAMPIGALAKSAAETSSIALFHQVQVAPPTPGARVGRGGGGPRVGRGGGGRRVGRGGGGRRIGRGGGGRRGGFRGGRRGGRGLGAAAAIGVGAALLGAIAGSAAANRREREVYEEVPPPRRVYRDRDVEYCMRRFRSYNPRTGLYRGYDGRMHPCP